MALEIERKFIIKALPTDLVVNKEYTIIQNYLATGEEEVRIRAKFSDGESDYTLTTKSGSGLVRSEVCTVITVETYTQLSNLDKNPEIIKTRKTVSYATHEIELDIYKNPILQDLIIAEVEFTSAEEAETFQPPLWFGVEVTNNPKYKNQNLWQSIQSEVAK